jgi:hypothetical protein
MLPLPKGYQPRTPPPPHQPQAQPRPSSAGAPGGGTVMYFQKPADALTATGGPGSSTGGVAQLSEPARMPIGGAPDAPASALPPPPASRYPSHLPPAITVPVASAQPEPVVPQPDPLLQPGEEKKTTSQKKQVKIPPVPDEAIRLPSRDKVFMVYDDPQLERAIMERVIRDRVEDIEKQIKDAKATGQDTAALEKNLADLRSLKNPGDDPKFRFPALPVISPPGVAYQPKTPLYEPRQLLIEPGYVVHRRLHFEEKNSERYGWDIGPAQTLISTMYFWRDTLLWPQSLASSCIRGPWDTSAGKCLPGSPVPYYLYPLGLTCGGTAFEAAIIAGAAAIFP